MTDSAVTRKIDFWPSRGGHVRREHRTSVNNKLSGLHVRKGSLKELVGERIMLFIASGSSIFFSNY